MTEVYMEITGAVATARKVGPLTAGMVGVPVMFSFSPEWQELNLLAVFRAGEEKKDNEIKEGSSVIPAQVLTQPGQMLCIGVEGRSKDGALVIPTVWAEVGRILDGAQAANDPALAPTPTQFERFMAGLEQVDEKLRESLRQAKESGAFNGTSVTHRWEGTTLEVTSASGTSRAELKGEPGHTPVKGVDYFTEEDKQAFQEAVCVTCDHSTGKCSHTLAQIQELAARGKVVTLKTSDSPEYTYYLQDSESGLFVSLDPGGEALNYYYASVNREGDVDQHKNRVPIDAVRFYATQLLSEEFKARARDNIGAAAAAEAVKTVNGVSPDANGNVQVETSSQSDWNAAEGEPGHVLNRTHWVESGMVEILPETVFEIPENDFGVVEGSFSFTVGETYIVNWDGTEYECVGLDASEKTGGEIVGVFLGNPAMFGEADNGMPFCMFCVTGMGIMGCLVSGEAGTAAVSIYHNSENIHKLPGKFLPEGVPYVEKGGMVEILPMTEAVFVDDVGFTIPTKIEGVESGKSYIVNYNGTEYNCVSQDFTMMPGAVVLGDAGLMDGEPVTGEPFLFLILPDEMFEQVGAGGQILTIDGAETVSVSISAVDETLHKVDPRLLPNDLVKDILIVNVATLDGDYKPATASHTGSDLKNACLFGKKAALFAYDGKTLPLITVSDTEVTAEFGNIYFSNGSLLRDYVVIDVDGNITTYEMGATVTI